MFEKSQTQNRVYAACCIHDLQERTEHDPLAEADDLDALGPFLKSWDVTDDEMLRTKTLLVSRTFTDVPREEFQESAADLCRSGHRGVYAR